MLVLRSGGRSCVLRRALCRGSRIGRKAAAQDAGRVPGAMCSYAHMTAKDRYSAGLSVYSLSIVTTGS